MLEGIIGKSQISDVPVFGILKNHILGRAFIIFFMVERVLHQTQSFIFKTGSTQKKRQYMSYTTAKLFNGTN